MRQMTKFQMINKKRCVLSSPSVARKLPRRSQIDCFGQSLAASDHHDSHRTFRQDDRYVVTLVVLVFMRGLLQATRARIYFSDEASNAEDGILALVPAERRHTLVAQAQGKGLYHWDVRMQGPDETVFFAY